MSRPKSASTQPEQSSRTGAGGELHQQPSNGGALLTTNQGVVIADNQNSLRAAPRGPTLLEDSFCGKRSPILIMSGYAGGSCMRAGLVPAATLRSPNRSASAPKPTFCRGVGDKTPVFVRFSTQGVQVRAICRATCAASPPNPTLGRAISIWSAQHAYFLYSGRDDVSRPRAFGQNGAGPQLSAGGFGARHLLGFRIADAGKHAHDHVGDGGSGDPALPTHDRRVWRQYLPARRRKR